MTSADSLLFRDETYRIRKAVFDVNGAMGPGFLEAVYQECLALEFARQGVPFVAQKALPISYRGAALRQSYIADFLCYDQIVIELKATRTIAPEHRAQTLNYVRAAGVRLGLLVNFGAASAEIERFAF